MHYLASHQKFSVASYVKIHGGVFAFYAGDRAEFCALAVLRIHVLVARAV